MSKTGNSVLVGIGIAFLLCVPAFIIGVGLISYYLPREYFSKATIEVRPDFPAAFTWRTARQQPRWQPDAKSLELRVMSTAQQAAGPDIKSMELRQLRGRDLFEIGFYDRDPERAADRANEVALAVEQAFLKEVPKPTPIPGQSQADRVAAEMNYDMQTMVCHMWEKAEPALAPSRPNVSFIMFAGIGGAVFFAGAGSILIMIGMAGRADRDLSEARPA
jgi:hypothetical protein